MINLLPNIIKQQIRAGRTNTVLVKYIIVLVLSVAFLASACYISYLFLTNSKTGAERLLAITQSKNTESTSITDQANAISASLATAKNILDQQVSYSNIITELAAVLPAGVILDSLSLTNSVIGTPIILKAHAKTADNVATLKANFQKSQLFSNYNMTSLTTSSDRTTDYPVVINIGITINKSISQ